MIHYHVWFDLKPHVIEVQGLAIVVRFLERLTGDDEAVTFQLLRNRGTPPRSKLGRYHALIEFADDAQLAEAMRRQTTRGVHTGLHGDVIDVVTNFHVEIFATMESLRADSGAACHACEI